MRSRNWDPGDLQFSLSVLGLLVDTPTQTVGNGTVFRYRFSSREHPISQRKTAEAAVSDYWWGSPSSAFQPTAGYAVDDFDENEKKERQWNSGNPIIGRESGDITTQTSIRAYHPHLAGPEISAGRRSPIKRASKSGHEAARSLSPTFTGGGNIEFTEIRFVFIAERFQQSVARSARTAVALR